MKKRWITILLLFSLLCVFPASAMAAASDKALIPEMELTEAQKSWISELEQFAPCWDRFQTVDVPEQSWFRVYALPGNVYALFENRQSELAICVFVQSRKADQKNFYRNL